MSEQQQDTGSDGPAGRNSVAGKPVGEQQQGGGLKPPDDLIPLSLACKRGPRPARGARRHRSTVLRWVLAGKLRGWRVLGHWYVSAAELDALLRPEPAAVAPDAPSLIRERAAATDVVLRQAGVRR